MIPNTTRGARSLEYITIDGNLVSFPLILSTRNSLGGNLSSPPGGIDLIEATLYEGTIKFLLDLSVTFIYIEAPGLNASIGTQNTFFLRLAAT